MTKPDFFKCDCQHCAGHVEFPAAALGQTIPCPHCGQPTLLSAPATEPDGEAEKSAGRRSIWGILGPLIAIAALAAVYIFLYKRNHVPPPTPETLAVTATNPPAVTRPADEVTTTNSFAISGIKLEKTPGSSLVYVTGILRNESDKQRYGVKLQLNLFDANGAPAGTATDFHQNIDPNGDWHFKALVLSSKAVSAKLNAVLEDQ